MRFAKRVYFRVFYFTKGVQARGSYTYTIHFYSICVEILGKMVFDLQVHVDILTLNREYSNVSFKYG